MNKAPANGDQAKMMRFLAGQFDNLVHEVNMVGELLAKAIATEASKINDKMGQVLRVLGPERFTGKIRERIIKQEEMCGLSL